jgi:uncharacterized membrane protein
MSWARRFGIRQHVRGSLWVLPLFGGMAGVLLGILDVQVDQSVNLPPSWTYSSSTASTLLTTIVGAMAALTGFVVTVTVLVVQMATGTFSARYMRLWYRDRLLKALLALLVGTLAFSFALLRRTGSNFVPNLGVTLAGVLVVVCLLVFVVFLDVYLHRLRPVAVAVLVAQYIYRDFRRLAERLAGARDVFGGSFDPGEEQPVLIIRSDSPGAIQAIDAEALVRWAREHGCLVAFRHRIGDFVPAGATLLEVYGDSSPATSRNEAELSGSVALGDERTIEQDPAFAIRIMVDIADQALSPAVNDPTTAVQILDHLGEVLRVIGNVDDTESAWDPNRGIRQGLVFPVRDWEEYLTLAVTEIRSYGGNAIQVMRRMRAMLLELRDQVPPHRRPAVEEELRRLEATVARNFAGSVDLDRAAAADPQGIGGRSGPPERPVASQGAGVRRWPSD